MRLGLSTPVVIQIPGVAAEWERTADAADLRAVAAAADRLGFDFLTCSEHVLVPAEDAEVRGGTYWDPVATLSYLAACTTRIRLATSVVVLGYHHPLELAKRYGTLDRLSGGRLILGVGVGSLRAEFDMLQAPWEDRGARADDALTALRACLSTNRPGYDGPFYRFSDVVVEPCAVQPRVPIWVGGRTGRSLRRAVTLADGWMPFGLRYTEITEMIARQEIPDGFDIVLPVGGLDPIGAPERTAAQLGKVAALGASAVTCGVTSRSVSHYCEQLEALRQVADVYEWPTERVSACPTDPR
ncbi:LLM class F420-dependent oxidoreductase [Mycolicibacterium parafortuitum]|uniref:Luciferase-like monooxygenase [Thermomonospora curvata DSM] n=1 Tax=Mycolicibacterium parafortuitum TaxID=39692 RepID=A0A375YIA3_MYCPF|nr:LLM class F420-dependent oxidoreductase [Mycolicibacterium parafortuitum]ORB32139.1 LLM class F420-dependent oxidoreductase [Mycolicibacterium parafortuitum]SRX80813.1 luciferase-like monooxygenase [Thermomonospora curvata DSM] [Mycolicibacterium parafortuitum]